MPGLAKSVTVKGLLRYDNGDQLEVEYANLRPEVSVALIDLLQKYKKEPDQ